jgi:2-polyprenyl-3-methyl-5-hydroxy-6-metoxy-1,4-benzoquinol methylase
MDFTGERLIPKINKNMACYYEHICRYLFACQFSSNKKILDAASGTGYGCYLLKKYGLASSVLGVDISPETIAYSKSNYKLPDVSYKVFDLSKDFNFSSSNFNLITSFETLEHLSDHQHLLQSFKKLLIKNGLLIISTPNTDNYPQDNIFHKKELNQNQFFSLLNKHFKNVQIFNQKYFLSQEIYTDASSNKLIDLKTNESLSQSLEINYKPKNTIKPEYFLALCSDTNIPLPKSVSLSVNHIDMFDFSSGILKNEADYFQHLNSIKSLQNELDEIKQSWLYKNIWPFYTRVKKLI